MEPDKAISPDSEDVKVVEWEDFEQEVARLWSLSSALKEAKVRKVALEQKLESLIQVKAESLSRLNELDEMGQKLEARKLAMGNMLMRSKIVAEDAKKQEERLSNEVRLLLVAGTALSVATKRLQEAKSLVSGERGYVHLKNLRRMLRIRQQYMISQLSFLYPVKALTGPAHELELESFSSSSRSGKSVGSKPLLQGTLTISGLQLNPLPSKTMSFFIDKKEVQRSATALGYVAHVVTLIAFYLEVPLRYPLRLGGSHSYINDYAPSVDPGPSDLSSNTLLSTHLKPVEFPLFLDGQDTTRAAYAVFLLNKDLEQLLNFIGIKSLGPRHVLANLKELLRIILSPEYTDMDLDLPVWTVS